MEEKHLNMKKVCGAIFIFIISFLIILGSALITHNARNREEKISNVSREIIEDDKIKPLNKSKNKVNNNEVQNTNKNFLENKKDIVLPQKNENAVQEIKNIYSSDEKQIFLTFDDGPSKKITPQILDILKEEQVPATFFVVGSKVELNPNLVKRAFEEGHYIANHGYSHIYSKIYESTQSVIDEYNFTEKAIQEAIGIPEYNSLLFRFPGGSSGGPYEELKEEAKEILANSGIASTNWNCLNGDAEEHGRTEEELLSRLYESQGSKTSLIILMHDAEDKQATANILRQVIQKYKSEGYVFKNFYEIF